MRHLSDRLHEVLTGMLTWVESFAATPYGVWALFAIAFAESSFFPVPPDVLLIALCVARPDSAFLFALVCTAGSVLGGIAGYGIGYYGGRPLMYRFFKTAKVRVVESYYDRFNAWATGIGGLTPLPYKIFTVAGGAFAARFGVFILASLLARGLRFFAVAGLIWLFGESITILIRRYINIVSILIVLCGIGGYWLLAHVVRRTSRQHHAEALRAEQATATEPPAEI